MIHSQDCIKLKVVSKTKESVWRIWSESHDAFIICRLDCREDDLLLLITEKTSVTTMRVKAENCNLRSIDSEIPLKRTLHETKLVDYLLGCNLRRHILKRYVTCNDADSQISADHEHRDILYAEFLLEILRMTCIAKPFSSHRPFIYRSCHKDIYISFLDILNSSIKGRHCRLCRLGRRLTRLNEHVLRQTVDNVHPLCMYILCRRDHMRIDLLEIMYLFLIESEYLR